MHPRKMNMTLETPLERAWTKLEQIERELKKSPDFQLYILAKSRKDRARMRRILMEIPQFRLWRALTWATARARHRQGTLDRHIVQGAANISHPLLP
jgi:hypothetical protein